MDADGVQHDDCVQFIDAFSMFELGRMIVDGLGRFCRSADDVPLSLHIPVDEKIDERPAEWLQSGLLPYVERLWGESKDPRGRGAILPDVYLKVWAQSGPRIESDFILLDEAQNSDGDFARPSGQVEIGCLHGPFIHCAS